MMNSPTVVRPGTQSAPSNGTATCVIGCKLPHGLVMEVGIVKERHPNGVEVLVRGPRYAAFVCKGRNAEKVVGGYGITTGVPTDLAKQWFKDNAQLRYIRDGSFIMVSDLAQLRGEAKDRLGGKTGFEPVNPLEPKPGDPNPGDAREAAQARAAYFAQVQANPTRGAQIDELGDAGTGSGAIAPAASVPVPLPPPSGASK